MLDSDALIVGEDRSDRYALNFWHRVLSVTKYCHQGSMTRSGARPERARRVPARLPETGGRIDERAHLDGPQELVQVLRFVSGFSIRSDLFPLAVAGSAAAAVLSALVHRASLNGPDKEGEVESVGENFEARVSDGLIHVRVEFIYAGGARFRQPAQCVRPDGHCDVP